jgi:hypothetical protein
MYREFRTFMTENWFILQNKSSWTVKHGLRKFLITFKRKLIFEFCEMHFVHKEL